MKAAYHIQSGIVCIILFLSQSIAERAFMESCVEILGHTYEDYANHIHMLVKIPPTLSISQFMGFLKGKSALMIFDNHSNLKYKFGQRTFWAKGYYVSTVGLNKNTIKNYIKNQELEDKIDDSRNIKEYQDPFKGV